MVKNGKNKKKYHKPTKAHHHSSPPPAEENKPVTVKTLPADLVLEIFYRTPVKSLVRCYCVCKSWSALMHHPTFIEMHLNFNTSRNNKHLLCNTVCDDTLSRKLIAFLRLTGPPIPVLRVDTEFTDRPNYPRIINFPDFSKHMSLAGSINGIVCLAHYMEMFGRFVALWNPAINYWKPIVVSETQTIYDRLDDMSFGLGFDAVADDFKIIRVVPVSIPPNYEKFCWSRVEIYSANRDVWEDVDKGGVIPFQPKVRHCNFIVKGVPYWIGVDADSRDYEPSMTGQLQVLGRIDPLTGLFKVAYPEHIKNRSTLVYPVNLKDSVAALIQSPGKHPNQMVDLYVRDENTARWTKMYSIGPLGFEGMRIPQCFSTGEIVLETWTGNINIYDSSDRVTYICDPKNSSVLLYNEIDTLRPFWFMSYSHVESLVCVKGMVQIGKERRDKKTNPNMKNWIEFLSRDFESALHDL
ncbi:putative F-box protein At1g53370 [Apium graveolens]|uniref:putative F-box protein At1g53370 n=1 Tax=Apium graveolens TaxID=4045 RepID=UPI003D7A78F7